MIVAIPQAFPENDVRETPGDTEQMSGNCVDQATNLLGLLGHVRVVEVDDGGDEETREEGDEVSLGDVTLTQSLLQPDMAVVPDTSPTRHHTRS